MVKTNIFKHNLPTSNRFNIFVVKFSEYAISDRMSLRKNVGIKGIFFITIFSDLNFPKGEPLCDGNIFFPKADIVCKCPKLALLPIFTTHNHQHVEAWWKTFSASYKLQENSIISSDKKSELQGKIKEILNNPFCTWLKESQQNLKLWKCLFQLTRDQTNWLDCDVDWSTLIIKYWTQGKRECDHSYLNNISLIKQLHQNSYNILESICLSVFQH